MSYGCRAYGFVGRRLPADIVWQASGAACLLYKETARAAAERKTEKEDEELNGWMA